MAGITFRYSNATVDFFPGAAMSALKQLADPATSIIITDENVFAAHGKKFRHWNTIVLKAGEEFKVQATVDSIVDQLIGMDCNRNSTLVGIGGGVVTDITGYVASVYMRGIRFGFVPTSLLAMVDASVGGKNGVDVGVYKNMIGLVKQPAFILHDMAFLNSLPEDEWKNGFAEIIKHACIKDASMFRELNERSLPFYMKKKQEIAALVKRNVLLKNRLVVLDEFEKGDRKLLNFGHTLGHALENQYELSHGQAIAVGMCFAAQLSYKIKNFRKAHDVFSLIEKYGLPSSLDFDKNKVIRVLSMDKKKDRSHIHYVLLERIGKAVLHPVTPDQIFEEL
jgi:3-dehydroquinate synthase